MTVPGQVLERNISSLSSATVDAHESGSWFRTASMSVMRAEVVGLAVVGILVALFICGATRARRRRAAGRGQHSDAARVETDGHDHEVEERDGGGSSTFRAGRLIRRHKVI